MDLTSGVRDETRPLGSHAATGPEPFTSGFSLEVEQTENQGGLRVEPVPWSLILKSQAEEAKSIRALLVLLALTASFTVAQFFGAYLANSLSMYGDCFTMGVDVMTYVLNILAERRKWSVHHHLSGKSTQRDADRERIESLELEISWLDVKVSLLSGVSLSFVTIYIMYDAGLRLHSEAGVAPVNSHIMYVFSAVNLLLNMLSCAAFCCRCSIVDCLSPTAALAQKAHEEEDHHEQHVLSMRILREAPAHASRVQQLAGEASSPDVGLQDLRRRSHSYTSELEADRVSSSGGLCGILRNLNLLSAFIHLAADTLRSGTVFATSAYVWSSGADAVRADAISSLIVCALILLAVSYLVCETCGRCRSLHLSKEPSFSPLPSVPRDLSIE